MEIFAQEFEPASYFCDWTLEGVIKKWFITSCSPNLITYGSWEFFFSTALPVHNRPETHFRFINSPIHTFICAKIFGFACTFKKSRPGLVSSVFHLANSTPIKLTTRRPSCCKFYSPHSTEKILKGPIYLILVTYHGLKGVFSKPSGNCIVVPNFCLLC